MPQTIITFKGDKMRTNLTVTIAGIKVIGQLSTEMPLEVAMDLTAKLLNAFTDSHPDLSDEDRRKIEAATSVIETHRKANG